MMPVLSFGELNILVFAAFIMGIMLGAVYGLLTVAFLLFFNGEGKSRMKKIVGHTVRFFLDMIFGLVCTASAVLLFSSYGKGQVRIIALLTMSIGFLLWHKTVGRLYLKIAVIIKKAFLTSCRFIYMHSLYYLVKYLSGVRLRAEDKRKEKEFIKYHNKQDEIIKNYFGRGKI